MFDESVAAAVESVVRAIFRSTTDSGPRVERPIDASLRSRGPHFLFLFSCRVQAVLLSCSQPPPRLHRHPIPGRDSWSHPPAISPQRMRVSVVGFHVRSDVTRVSESRQRPSSQDSPFSQARCLHVSDAASSVLLSECLLSHE
jgi:hypothetical protein